MSKETAIQKKMRELKEKNIEKGRVNSTVRLTDKVEITDTAIEISNGNGNIASYPKKTLSLDIYTIQPNPYQTRKKFNNIEKLAASIRNRGLIQIPVVFMKDDVYYLLAGERRLRALKLNHEKFSTPKILDFLYIDKDLTEQEQEDLCIIENEERQNITLIERAESILNKHNQNMSIREIEELDLFNDGIKGGGLKKTAIASYINIAKLPEEVKEILNRSDIVSTSKIEHICKIDDLNKQIELAHIIANTNPPLKTIESLIKKYLKKNIDDENKIKFALDTTYDKMKSPTKILSKSSYRKLPEIERVEADEIIFEIISLQAKLEKYNK